MKAISLWEPWASAIATGLKKIETRGWAPRYRGPLAIHAALTKEHAGFIHLPEVRPHFEAVGIRRIEDLAFGCVVATCRLVACRLTQDIERDYSIDPRELLFGNYEPGRFGWVLEEIVRLPKPIPARGSQGFWEWEPNPKPAAAWKPEGFRLE